jgi:hypothetical protein
VQVTVNNWLVPRPQIKGFGVSPFTHGWCAGDSEQLAGAGRALPHRRRASLAVPAAHPRELHHVQGAQHLRRRGAADGARAGETSLSISYTRVSCITFKEHATCAAGVPQTVRVQVRLLEL